MSHFAKAGLRMNENTFEPILLKPDLDLITEPRRAAWQRGHALVLTLKAWALIWRMDFRPDGLAQG
jgi:hypothetical protein